MTRSHGDCRSFRKRWTQASVAPDRTPVGDRLANLVAPGQEHQSEVREGAGEYLIERRAWGDAVQLLEEALEIAAGHDLEAEHAIGCGGRFLDSLEQLVEVLGTEFD